MKLLDIFKRKKNAELECLRDAYNTLDKQLQFVTRENESLRKANNRLSEQINSYKGIRSIDIIKKIIATWKISIALSK